MQRRRLLGRNHVLLGEPASNLWSSRNCRKRLIAGAKIFGLREYRDRHRTIELINPLSANLTRDTGPRLDRLRGRSAEYAMTVEMRIDDIAKATDARRLSGSHAATIPVGRDGGHSGRISKRRAQVARSRALLYEAASARSRGCAGSRRSVSHGRCALAAREGSLQESRRRHGTQDRSRDAAPVA